MSTRKRAALFPPSGAWYAESMTASRDDDAEQLAEATARAYRLMRRHALAADVPAPAVAIAALALAVEAQQLAGRPLTDLQTTTAEMWRDLATRRTPAGSPLRNRQR